MQIYFTLLAMPLLVAAGVAAPGSQAGSLTFHDDLGALNTVDNGQGKKGDCWRGCMFDSDCCKGDFCIASWCTKGRKVEDGVIVPAELNTRGLESDVVEEEDDDFYYYEDPEDVAGAGEKKKKKPKSKCPKKCGNGVHCCKHDFCYLGKCSGTHEPRLARSLNV